MCRIERWDVRSLRKKIDGMLYERTPPELVFRDPYQSARARITTMPEQEPQEKEGSGYGD